MTERHGAGLIEGIREWAASRSLPFDVPPPASRESTELWRLTEEVSRLICSTATDPDMLSRIQGLFTEIAETSYPPDAFGERFEIALALAYLGWRQAFRLGREEEAQYWIRVSDGLVSEQTADVERLESFLSLPNTEKTQDLCSSFLESPQDVFVSLSILRRDRLIKPLRVIAAAEAIWKYLRGSPVVAGWSETAIFLAETAWLIAAAYRMLGRRTESREWLAVAKARVKRLPCGSALRNKLHLVSAVKHMDEHRHRQLLERLRRLRMNFTDLGMYVEAISCRFAIAWVTKIVGENEAAYREYVDIVAECRETTLQSLVSMALMNLAVIDEANGARAAARDAQKESIERAVEAGDLLSLSCALGSVAESNFARGDFAESARIYGVAAKLCIPFGTRYWQAYSKVLEAEAFIAGGRLGMALQSLSVAVPLIRQEEMVAVGVHALKLLSDIAARSTDGRELLMQLMSEVSPK